MVRAPRPKTPFCSPPPRPQSAQHLDDKGRCHDEHGKYAKTDVCKGGHGPERAYKMDNKG
jgi:hypothetical protein